MSLYGIALFVHIVGALLLFGLLTAEGTALRVGISAAPLGRTLGPISAVAILVPGLYMMAAQWGVKGWIVVGITSWVLIAVGGAFTGISVVRGRMGPRTATFSWLARVGMGLGVVFDMTLKPDVVVAVVAVLVGLVVGVSAATLVTPRPRRSV